MSEPFKDRPNIFDYATKELSQDAMICWLIAWAGQSKDAAREDEALQLCGRQFVCTLLNHKRSGKAPIELEDEVKTEIYQQERRIDVLARINGKHVLLIEDKTGTKDHDKKLSRYYHDVVRGSTQIGKVAKKHLWPIYLKTGNQPLRDDSRIEEIKNCNYKVFNRADFLNVLNGYKGRNPILVDFRQYLQGLENKTNSYAEWKRDDKRDFWRAWEGLYRRLECELGPRNGWGYVSNRAGGFLGFWRRLSSNYEIYLQIETKPGEETKLCFKVNAEGKTSAQQDQLKGEWHDLVLKAGGLQVVKPKVMKRGEHMTVAWWKECWLAFDKDAKLDIPDTVRNLKRADKVLKDATDLR